MIKYFTLWCMYGGVVKAGVFVGPLCVVLTLFVLICISAVDLICCWFDLAVGLILLLVCSTECTFVCLFNYFDLLSQNIKQNDELTMMITSRKIYSKQDYYSCDDVKRNLIFFVSAFVISTYSSVHYRVCKKLMSF